MTTSTLIGWPAILAALAGGVLSVYYARPWWSVVAALLATPYAWGYLAQVPNLFVSTVGWFLPLFIIAAGSLTRFERWRRWAWLLLAPYAAFVLVLAFNDFLR